MLFSGFFRDSFGILSGFFRDSFGILFKDSWHEIGITNYLKRFDYDSDPEVLFSGFFRDYSRFFRDSRDVFRIFGIPSGSFRISSSFFCHFRDYSGFFREFFEGFLGYYSRFFRDSRDFLAFSGFFRDFFRIFQDFFEIFLDFSGFFWIFRDFFVKLLKDSWGILLKDARRVNCSLLLM